MRRLSMKGKRGKSETTSDGESEENGVATVAAQSADREDASSEANDASENTPKRAPKKGAKRGRKSQEVEQSDKEDELPKENQNGNTGGGKRRKKDEQKASTSGNKRAEGDEEYEVAKVVAQRTIKGRRQFLVRWKGYGEDSDTWEQEKDLNCPELIEEFLAETTESSGTEKSPKTSKTKERKTEKKSRKSKGGRKKESDVDGPDKGANSENDGEETKEFEVEKIMEVYFKKNKGREFLIRWKGFTPAEDTWEPEENLNCPDLIARFMEKVTKAKQSEVRELRTAPPHTKRYTLSTNEAGRRLSRRNKDKQRATYHECDE